MADDALGAGVAWIVAVLLGPVATSVALLAVAALGALMLSGRLPARRALHVVVGCFILFSASTIAAGVMSFAEQSETTSSVPPPPAPSYTPTVPKTTPYDPYADASVPEPQPTQSGLIQ